MGKKPASPPPPPDPQKTAAAQQQLNEATLRLNYSLAAQNQFTPWGAVTYDRRPDGTPFAVRVRLSPEQQRLYDQQTGVANSLYGLAANRIGQLPRDAFTLEGIPELMSDDDVQSYANRISDAYYNRAANTLRPQFTQDYDRLENTLYERGLPMGSGAAYDKEIGNLRRSQGDVLENLALDAQTRGGAEASRLFGISGQRRQDAINSRLMERNQAFNEAAMFMGGAPNMPLPQAPNLPAFQSQPADFMGATYNSYNAALQNYQLQQQQRSSMLSGLFGLGGSLIGLL